MKAKASLSAIGLLCAALLSPLQGDEKSALIIGGKEGEKAYAGLLSSSGKRIPLTGAQLPPTNGVINSVSINNSGKGIITGADASTTPITRYIALFDPSGELNAPESVNQSGDVFSAGINDAGYSIVGGTSITDETNSLIYGTLLSPRGYAIPVIGSGFGSNPPGGFIWAASINRSNHALLGGVSDGLFAVLVKPNGSTIQLSGNYPNDLGSINNVHTVALNDFGHGILGGNRDNKIFAAISDKTGHSSEITGPHYPSINGVIYSVAINSSGFGLIGGQSLPESGTQHPYVAQVSPTGYATPLTGFPLESQTGSISSVVLNESGTGLIGGQVDGKIFAALVAPNSMTTRLSGLPLESESGSISSVALNESGTGLIGGQVDGKTFAALVAPNGMTSPLTGTLIPAEAGTINSVAMSKAIDPSSFGPGNSFASPVLTLSTSVLRSHLNSLSKAPSQQNGTLSLVVSRSDKIYGRSSDEKMGTALWFTPYGEYRDDKAHSSFPSVIDRSVGGMMGFDRSCSDECTVGFGLAYAYQDLHYSENKGNATVNQELLALYGSWQGTNITLDGALWGGLYQMHQQRETLGIISSDSRVQGGLLNPHVGVKLPYSFSNTTLTPFLSFDWVNNWQGKVSETGPSGFNLRMDPHYVSLLRSELGLSYSQRIEITNGVFAFQEGISYVNQTTFNAKEVTAYYVNSISTFGVQLFDGKVQNLGALQFSASYLPKKNSDIAISLSCQGEWGKHHSSVNLALELKKGF